MQLLQQPWPQGISITSYRRVMGFQSWTLRGTVHQPCVFGPLLQTQQFQLPFSFLKLQFCSGQLMLVDCTGE